MQCQVRFVCAATVTLGALINPKDLALRGYLHVWFQLLHQLPRRYVLAEYFNLAPLPEDFNAELCPALSWRVQLWKSL